MQIKETKIIKASDNGIKIKSTSMAKTQIREVVNYQMRHLSKKKTSKWYYLIRYYKLGNSGSLQDSLSKYVAEIPNSNVISKNSWKYIRNNSHIEKQR